MRVGEIWTFVTGNGRLKYCDRNFLRPHCWCDRAYSVYTIQSAILIRA
jgi:hypothetical protein